MCLPCSVGFVVLALPKYVKALLNIKLLHFLDLDTY
jgi:hypothetical protein